MRKKAYLTILFSIISQVVTILSGLIVPRLVLSTFGSEVNGLVSSLTQFLNYISLIEGGLGSVVLAGLYKPLAEKDTTRMNAVLNAANRFFKQITYVLLAYGVILGIAYPVVVKSSFSPWYVLSLTLILGIGLFIQYFFSITYKLLLQADQKMYVVQIVQTITSLINLITSCVLIRLFPEIHIVKLGSALIFLVQPLIYSRYVKKRYIIDKKVKVASDALLQRWACFGQNFAYFIHSNTDVVVLSIFTNLKTVSVYYVYFLVVNNIKNFLLSFSNAFSPMIGKALAQKNFQKVNEIVDAYEFVIFNISTIIFGCCMYLLPSFVLIYTNGVTDANYYQPIFSMIIILAEWVYCVREPYIAVVYSAGKFKETAQSAYMEAGLNIVISVVTVIKFGLVGIAIGTCIGMTYRMVYQVLYINKNIIGRSFGKFIRRILISGGIFLGSSVIIKMFDHTGSTTILLWVKNGTICVLVYVVVTCIVNLVFDRKQTMLLLRRFK